MPPPLAGAENANAISLDSGLFSGDAGGLGSLFRATACKEVGDRLGTIELQPLSRTELNQLLHLCHEAGLSEGFFQYYWLRAPLHTYDVSKLPGFQPTWIGTTSIISKEHLLWGVYRACMDGLFYFGDMRTGYRELRAKSDDDLSELLRRVFDNQMEYELDQKKEGYYLLREKLTQSVVRLQTSDKMLREAFWNYYHNRV